MWLALVIANRGLTLTNLAYEVFATAMMVALMFAYRASVHGRRKIANAVRARVGLASFAVDPRFMRDLQRIALRREVKVILYWLTGVTLAIYLAGGFVRLPSWLAGASMVVWLIFGIWAAGRIIGLPRSTVAFLRVNIAVFAVLFYWTDKVLAPLASGSTKPAHAKPARVGTTSRGGGR